jgi:hypothetical protein
LSLSIAADLNEGKSEDEIIKVPKGIGVEGEPAVSRLWPHFFTARARRFGGFSGAGLTASTLADRKGRRHLPALSFFDGESFHDLTHRKPILDGKGDQDFLGAPIQRKIGGLGVSCLRAHGCAFHAP